MGFLEKPIVRDLLLLVFGLALGVLAHYLVRIHLLPRLQKLLRKTRIKWDDVLFEQGVFGAAALLIPLVVMFRVTPFLTVLQGGATASEGGGGDGGRRAWTACSGQVWSSTTPFPSPCCPLRAWCRSSRLPSGLCRHHHLSQLLGQSPDLLSGLKR